LFLTRKGKERSSFSREKPSGSREKRKAAFFTKEERKAGEKRGAALRVWARTRRRMKRRRDRVKETALFRFVEKKKIHHVRIVFGERGGKGIHSGKKKEKPTFTGGKAASTSILSEGKKSSLKERRGKRTKKKGAICTGGGKRGTAKRRNNNSKRYRCEKKYLCRKN